MAQDKNSIVFYRDWKEIFESLNDSDCAELVRHIFRYVNDEDPKTENPLVNAHFLHIKNCLKRDLKKWEAQRAKKVEAGRIGGKHTQAKRSTAKQNEANQAVNVNGSVSVNGSVTVSEIKNNILSDYVFIDELKRIHRGKDIKQAFSECFSYHSANPNSKQWEEWEWRQKINSWLTIKRVDPSVGLNPNKTQ